MSITIPQKTHDIPARHSDPDMLIMVAGEGSYQVLSGPATTAANSTVRVRTEKAAHTTPQDNPAVFVFLSTSLRTSLDHALLTMGPRISLG